MVSADTIRTAVGVLGNIISFCLFMSPTPTFISIYRTKSVQDYRPDPYIVTMMNCATWAFYGMPLVTDHNILVLTINAFGLVVETLYTLVFVIYSPWNKRRRILLIVLAEVIFLALLVFIVLFFFHEIKQRKLIVGIVALVFNILMYFSPLTVMKRVIQTKSVKYMPLLLSVAGVANSLIWTSYAFLKWDPFVAIPNSLGAVSGLTQLVLYCIYYKTTNWDEESPQHGSL
ncbi:hypothetical protein VNO77_24668 [Canavalia gladiata]|uniref:Bidirectional sugar transporter SWEET n=1 Tax=Canavalia gladiata TaxID=3824 RepID=A0AAN9LC27_CANGL